jgi:hypothetical protein
MNVAPHRAEQWVLNHNRLLLSDTEQFLAAPGPIPVLLNRSGVGNTRQPHFGTELRLLIDRNAAGNPTFLTPQPSANPWTYSGTAFPPVGGIGWSFRGDGTIQHVPDAALNTLILTGLVPSVTYNVTFTLSGRTAGSVTPVVCGTNGTARSTNGTFTEAIIGGAVPSSFSFDPSADFAGFISAVSITPNTAPGTCAAALYTCPDANVLLRSTEAWATVTLPSDTKTVVRHDSWRSYLDTASGFDLGLKLSAAYTAGKVFASVWTRRYWWGQPASPG